VLLDQFAHHLDVPLAGRIVQGRPAGQIDIGIARNQGFDPIEAPLNRRQHEGGFPIGRDRIDIGFGPVEQGIKDLGCGLEHRLDQRGRARFVHPVGVKAALQKVDHHLMAVKLEGLEKVLK